MTVSNWVNRTGTKVEDPRHPFGPLFELFVVVVFIMLKRLASFLTGVRPSRAPSKRGIGIFRLARLCGGYEGDGMAFFIGSSYLRSGFSVVTGTVRWTTIRDENRWYHTPHRWRNRDIYVGPRKLH